MVAMIFCIMIGREAHRGLVEHEQLGPAHQGAAHGEHLLLAAGEGAGGLLAAFAEDGEELVDALRGRR